MEKGLIKIGILREEGDTWERRTPLTPDDCLSLQKEGILCVLQPSEIRCFSDDDYKEKGCEINEDLSQCNLILGIQRVKSNRLIADKSYIFFAKAVKGNLSHEVLDTIIKKRVRLYDYEGIKYKGEGLQQNQVVSKVVSFGKIAGMVGVANIFKGIAELLLSRKFSTPFLFSKLSYMYSDIEHLKQSFVDIGNFISTQYLPAEICPFVVAILGNGQAASGALEILKCLPHKFIKPEELPFLKKTETEMRDKIYICVFEYKHIYVNAKIKTIGSEQEFYHNKIDYEAFDKKHFQENPELYFPILKYYLEFISCIINTLYWVKSFKRIIKKSHLLKSSIYKDSKLMAIADISCDMDGAIEVMNKYTTYQKPFQVYEPVTNEYLDQIDKASTEAIIYMSIPKLAASLADDASIYFSQLIYNYVVELAKTEYSSTQPTVLSNSILQNALVAENGAVTQTYKSYFSYNEKNENYKSKKEKPSQAYFVTIKIRGHIFDSGVFKKIIDDCKLYKVIAKPIFMKVGVVDEEISIVYFELFSDSKEPLMNFMSDLEQLFNSNHLESSIVKSNLS